MNSLGKKFLETAQAALGRIGLATQQAHVADLGPNAWELGELSKLAILEPDATAGGFDRYGCATLIDLSGRNIRIAVSRGNRQISLVGGNQRIDLDKLGAKRAGVGPVVIGPVHKLSYYSERSGKRLEYAHMFGYEFGSDFSELPILTYDPFDKRLEFVGGVYKVGKVQGVVN